MAITTTVINRAVSGDKRIVTGTSVISGGSSGGDIKTGLAIVDILLFEVLGSSEQGCSVDETFPLTSGDVTIVTEDSDSTVAWEAIGR